nr:auxin-responsive protein SAUR72-like [Ipomoea batatas]
MVGFDIIDHPMFQELVKRSGSCSDESIAIGCEVMLDPAKKVGNWTRQSSRCWVKQRHFPAKPSGTSSGSLFPASRRRGLQSSLAMAPAG